MEFRILGPLEVWDDGGQISLSGPKQRALLAVLLLHANEVVAGDRLIEELWGEDSTESAATALRVNVSRLRKALPRDVLVTRSPGYTIRLDPDQLDLQRFERLVDEGRGLLGDANPEDAAARLREALALWRGPALADFGYESFAQAAIARLEEIRLAALELRIEADLALGRDRELIGELEALTAEHPLRERLRGHLMTALYGSGRQAEALEVYQQTRRTLVEELGIEPSRALQELERAILRQDSALDAARAASHGRGESAERSILVAVLDEARLDALLSVAEPLVSAAAARADPRQGRAGSGGARAASAWLEERRAQIEARGLVARAASFTSSDPGVELARLASELDVDLLLADAPEELLADGVPGEQLATVLADAPCDVALLVPRAVRSDGPVLVPFGGAEHDWAAVELGAWLARAAGVPLQLAGAAAAPEQGKRDASRLLSHASLAVQRVLGVSARAAAGSARRGGHAGGEPRRRRARRRAVGALAPRGSRRGLASGSREKRRHRRCSSARACARAVSPRRQR